jgi:hypothetical protein
MKVLLLLFTFIAVSYCVVSQPFTSAEISAFVSAYNTYRNSQITPPAVSGSMKTISWDSNLAAIATNYAVTCPGSGTLMPHVILF